MTVCLELPSPRDPMAVARRLVTEHYDKDGHLLLRRWRGACWEWVTTCWHELDEAKVRGEADRYTEHAVWLDSSQSERSTGFSSTLRSTSSTLETATVLLLASVKVSGPPA